jgi:hypothetical protein
MELKKLPKQLESSMPIEVQQMRNFYFDVLKKENERETGDIANN